MNLATSPWIPVVDSSETKQLVSIRDVFDEGATQFIDFCVNPPQRIALMRLLICIAQAALDGPKDEESWIQARTQIVSSCPRYLDAWENVFSLYGDLPFLQVNNLQLLNNASTDKLDFGLSSGNNDTLFDHGATNPNRSHSDAWLALMLLTYQCFSPCGLTGNTSWNGKSIDRKSEHAPCLAGNPTHTILRGFNIRETVWLNLLTQEQVSRLPNGKWGCPIWQQFPSAPDDQAAVENATETYLGRLVPLSRAIQLQAESNRCTIGNGLTFPGIPNIREPSTALVLDRKNNVTCQRLQLDKHIWRELASILSLSHNYDNVGGVPVIDHLRTLTFPLVDIWVGGLVADQAQVIDTAEWNLSISTSAIEQHALSLYSEGVRHADEANQRLRKAVQVYCDELKLSQKKTVAAFVGAASKYFWTALDNHYLELVSLSTKQESIKGWKDLVATYQANAFQSACPHILSQQMQAYVKSRRHLSPRR